MAEALSEERKKELEAVFALYDRDGKGRISIGGLETVMSSLNQHPTNRELENIILEMDENEDNCIDFEEFVHEISKQENFDSEAELREIFNVFDKDGNGFVSPDELRKILMSFGENLTDEELDDMIKEADIDGDGQISYQDFVLTLTS